MTRAIYDPPAPFGLSFLKQDPVEVEFLGYESGGHTARILVVSPKNALINLLAFPDAPEKRVERKIERVVLAADLTLVPKETT